MPFFGVPLSFESQELSAFEWQDLDTKVKQKLNSTAGQYFLMKLYNLSWDSVEHKLLKTQNSSQGLMKHRFFCLGTERIQREAKGQARCDLLV